MNTQRVIVPLTSLFILSTQPALIRENQYRSTKSPILSLVEKEEHCVFKGKTSPFPFLFAPSPPLFPFFPLAPSDFIPEPAAEFQTVL